MGLIPESIVYVVYEKMLRVCGLTLLLLCVIDAAPIQDDAGNGRSLYEMQSQLYEQALGNEKSGFSIESTKSLYEKERALYSESLADKSSNAAPSEVLVQEDITAADPAFSEVLTGASVSDPAFHNFGGGGAPDPAFLKPGQELTQVSASSEDGDDDDDDHSVPDMIFGGRPDPAFNQAGHSNDPPSSHDDPAFAGTDDDALVQEMHQNPDEIFGTHNDPAFTSHPGVNGGDTGTYNDPEFTHDNLVQEGHQNPDEIFGTHNDPAFTSHQGDMAFGNHDDPAFGSHSDPAFNGNNMPNAVVVKQHVAKEHKKATKKVAPKKKATKKVQPKKGH